MTQLPHWIVEGPWSGNSTAALHAAKKYGNSIEAIICGVLYENREMFAILDEIVREETGVQIDSLIVSIFSCSFELNVADNQYYISTSHTAEKPPEYFDYHFGYGKSEMFDGDRKLEMTNPGSFISPQMLADLKTCKEFLKIMELFRKIASWDHDRMENFLAGSLVDHDMKNVAQEHPKVHKLVSYVRPAEQFIAKMSYKVLGRYFGRHPEKMDEIIADTIRYMGLLKTNIKEEPTLADKAEPLANFWMFRYLSKLFFHIPIMPHLERKLEVDGVQTSIVEAMQEYGFTYDVNVEKLVNFFKDRGIIPMHKSLPSHVTWLGYMRDIIEEDLIDHNHAYCALRHAVKCTEGMTPDAGGNIRLQGLDAALVHMMLESGKEYDLSHFWIHELEEVPYIPFGYDSIGSTLSNFAKYHSAMITKALGSPFGIVNIKPSQIALQVAYAYMNSPACMTRAKNMATRMGEYLLTQDGEMPDFMAGKIVPILHAPFNEKAALRELEEVAKYNTGRSGKEK